MTRVWFYSTWAERCHLMFLRDLDHFAWFLNKERSYLTTFYCDEEELEKIAFTGNFLINKLKINPYRDEWQEILAPELLRYAENRYDRRWVAIQASIERKQKLALKRAEKCRQRTIRRKRAQRKALKQKAQDEELIAQAAIILNPDLATEGQTADPVFADFCLRQQEKFTALTEQRREKRKAATVLRQNEEIIWCSRTNLSDDVAQITTQCGKDKRRRIKTFKSESFAQEAEKVLQQLVEAKITESSDDYSPEACEQYAKECTECIKEKHPDLYRTLNDWCVYTRARNPNLPNVYTFLQNLVQLSEVYPGGALIEQLKKIHNREDYEQAYHAIATEAATLNEVKDNFFAKNHDLFETCIQGEFFIDKGKKYVKKKVQNANAKGIWKTMSSMPMRFANGAVEWTGDAFASITQKICCTAGKAWERTADSIFSKLIGIFYESVAHLKKELGIAKDFFEMIVAKVKVWFQKICANLSTALEVMGKFAFFALVFFLGCGLCTLASTILEAFGFKVGQTLLVLFCTAVFGTIGFAYSEIASEPLRALQKQLTVTAQAMFAKDKKDWDPKGVGFDIVDGEMPGMYDDENDNAKSIPVLSSVVNALSGFGSCITSFRLDTVIEMGKIGAAMHSMRLGREALREFCSYILYYMGRMADKITGRETIFFDELSILAQCDVKGWIRRAQGCLLEANYTPVSNEAFAEVVSRLVDEGTKVRDGVAGIPRKTSMDFGMLISQINKDLLELHKRVVRCGPAHGKRKEPCWIYLVGESHCGKSNFMDALAKELCQQFDLPYTTIAKNARDAYWSGYARQTCLMIDDLSAFKVEPCFEGEMMQIVSCQDYPLNMADVADKPVFFNSPFVISSSNVPECPTDLGIKCVQAYNNRRAAVVDMRRKPGVQYTPDDIFAAIQGRFLDPATLASLHYDRRNPDAEWKDVPDLITECLNIAAMHRDEQDRLARRHNTMYSQHDPITAASENLLSAECMKHLVRVVPDVGGQLPHQILAVDGRVFKLSQDMDFEEMVYPHDDLKELERLCSQHILEQVRDNEYLNSKSVIVTAFVRGLVNEDCRVVSVEKLNKDASHIQARFFEKLKLGERVYLRILQKQIDKVNGEDPDNIYGKTFWGQMLHTIGAGRVFLEQHGCNVLLFAGAIILAVVCCYGFLRCFIGFVTGAFTIAGALRKAEEVDAKAQWGSGSDPNKIAGHRAKRVPVNYRYNHARSEAHNEMPRVGHLSVAIYTSSGYFVSGMQYKNKSIMLTRHQMLHFKEGEQLTLVYCTTGEQKLIRFYRHDVIEFEQKEICLWMAPTMYELPHKYRDLFFEKVDVLPNNYKVHGYVLREDEQAFHVDIIESYATTNFEPLPIRCHIGNTPYLQEIPKKMEFPYEARNHDCGMLMCAQVAGKQKVVGLLVAGRDQITWADFLPTPEMAMAMSTLEYEEADGVAEPGYFQVGYVEISKAPVMPKKTNLVEVPKELQVPVEIELKQPAIMSKEDPRCPEGVDPPRQALQKKFRQPASELDDEVLTKVTRDIVQEWFDCETELIEDLPLDKAINGIPSGTEEDALENFVMRTSPGFPYYLENRKTGTKGKHDFFQETETGELELKPHSTASKLYENLVQYTKTEVPPLVTIECPKDELLPMRKVTKADCRLFEIMPLHYNLFLRVKTARFTQFLQNNRHKLSCQVGTNAYSRDWCHIYQRLVEKNNEAINCDYSAYDGLMSGQLLEYIAGMINAMYQRSGDTQESLTQRFNTIMALHGRYAMVGNQVFKVNAGIPSGFALTVVVNSILNEVLIRYCYHVLVPGPQKDLFSDLVVILVYGDDNLIAWDSCLDPYFSGEGIRLTLKEFNITITDGSDKTAPTIEKKPLKELDFLKRKFKINEYGVVQAPLDRGAIFSCLHFVNPLPMKFHSSQKPMDFKGELDICEELLTNVNVALVELYLHGDKKEFDRVRNFYIKKIPTFEKQMRSWAFCECFHSEQQTQQGKFEPAKALDLIAGKGFTSFLRCSGEGDKKHFYVPHVGVCGPFYKKSMEDKVFFVSMDPLKEGENGVYIPIESTASGVGNLPTLQWVKRFAKPATLRDVDGHQCWNLIYENYLNGSDIIFRAHAPYVANNAALISFVVGAMIANLNDMLAFYNNSVPEKCDGMAQYFAMPIPPACSFGAFYLANEKSETLLKEYKAGFPMHFEDKGSTPFLIFKNHGQQALEKGKLPCLSADVVIERGKEKFLCGLTCSKVCIGHYNGGATMKEAFQKTWEAQCRTPGAKVNKFLNTHFPTS